MRQAKQERIEKILDAAVTVLAEKGYENATIKDIAAAANVNWGLLHYYFKNKEDLVVKSLKYASNVALEPFSHLFAVGGSPEEVVDNAIDLLKKYYRENPGFYKLLFEMWCASGRSKKIRKELIDCINHVTDSLRIKLEKTPSISIMDSVYEQESLVRFLLAMSDGLAFQLILDPKKLDDEETWQPFRNAALMLLGARSK